ncbi:glycoside hydrolase family 3 protein [Dendrothele bispora CBS 962.96]|uniref:beta-glucosidase n=1 Tax=Dendrothele bispora (strain CBS 962.96) TaxID=1314807 RepID=A0A4S8MAB0_DENBC|nr:glycoside hydrolase family 3 protein [Dendrothele bispora CBS 962.96]
MHSFLDASIPELVAKLTLDEKVSLLSAPNWWNTNAIPRLKIPSIRMSDGPNGVRGSSHLISTPAQCLPCATSLASTFDEKLIHEVGSFLALEAKAKASVVLLAPTCNIPRTPLGGRAFESFSEDPHLSGVLAAAYVNGLQEKGVAPTIKHFVANDQEHERTAAESVMSDRALREIYLHPFMLAQKLAKPWAFMTAYGRIKGLHCSENPHLLQDILRGEWGFDGVVISDWFGTYGVDQPINAGLDLEMPGPPRWRTPILIHQCLTAQKLHMSTINARVSAMLTFIQHQARLNPEVVFGDGKERTRDSPQIRAFCRKLAADGIVLLKNRSDVLPILNSKVKKIAVIGPNAKEGIISGGGSAALKASYVVTPFDGIKDGAPTDVEISYAVGCYSYKYLPTLESKLVTPDGKPGWLCTFYNQDDDGNTLPEPLAELVVQDTRVKLNDFLPPGLTETWTMKLNGKMTVDTTGPFELGLAVSGRAKLWIDGKMTIDNWTKQTPGDFFYGQGTIEEKAVIDMEADKSVDVFIEYTNTSDLTTNGDASAQPALMKGVRLGGCEKIDPDQTIQDAADLAKKSDVVVFVGGLSPEWESEGFDRPTLQLPGRQDELISRVAAANPNTIVCIQAGSATAMPWVNEVAGILQTWYLGNETGNAIADVIFGKVNPSGRLPITFPVRVQDIAAYPNLRSEKGQIHYREDIFVGYKHFQSKSIEPLFSFGFGLSYSKFTLSDLVIEMDQESGDTLSGKASVTIKNEGPMTGSAVLQLYISYPDSGITHVPSQLKAFTKIHDISPGCSGKATMTLDKYAVSWWDSGKNRWQVDAGEYCVHVGFNCNEIVYKDSFTIDQEFTWTGL